MKLRALFLSCCVALTGCATNEVLHQSSQHSEIAAIASLQKSEFKLDTQATVAIDGNTQILNDGEIDSPVVAFEIPSNRGPLDISVTSQMVDEKFFSPEIMIVDSEGEVIEKYDSSVFEYRRPRLAWGDRLVAEFRFTPPVTEKTVTMLIYTTDAELAKTTDRIHPMRAMAEGKGNYLPEVKDIPTPHTTTGQLLVEVNGASSGFFSGSEEKATKAENVAPKTEAVDEATQTYYHNAIRKAVEEDNIPKALSLLDEAKELGVEGAQKVYVDTLNSKT